MNNNNKKCFAVDFDGTLAFYESWEKQGNKVGAPIPLMLSYVQEWLAAGIEVSIFTARVSDEDPEENLRQKNLILNFLKENNLPELEITAIKKKKFDAFFDDKALHVIKNSGIFIPRNVQIQD